MLHECQALHGYLPEEMQRIIARKLGVPASKVYGVVTFYSFFTMTPKGKHPISVCLGTACDGKFSLDCLRCVGACGLAPVVMVGEHVYGRLDVKDIRQILENAAAED